MSNEEQKAPKNVLLHKFNIEDAPNGKSGLKRLVNKTAGLWEVLKFAWREFKIQQDKKQIPRRKIISRSGILREARKGAR